MRGFKKSFVISIIIILLGFSMGFVLKAFRHSPTSVLRGITEGDIIKKMPVQAEQGNIYTISFKPTSMYDYYVSYNVYAKVPEERDEKFLNEMGMIQYYLTGNQNPFVEVEIGHSGWYKLKDGIKKGHILDVRYKVFLDDTILVKEFPIIGHKGPYLGMYSGNNYSRGIVYINLVNVPGAKDPRIAGHKYTMRLEVLNTIEELNNYDQYLVVGIRFGKTQRLNRRLNIIVFLLKAIGILIFVITGLIWMIKKIVILIKKLNTKLFRR